MQLSKDANEVSTRSFVLLSKGLDVGLVLHRPFSLDGANVWCGSEGTWLVGWTPNFYQIVGTQGQARVESPQQNSQNDMPKAVDSFHTLQAKAAEIRAAREKAGLPVLLLGAMKAAGMM